MVRVLEIVLHFQPQAGQTGRDARSRAARDFVAELAKAWRLCSTVKMRRGHERVTIEPCCFDEAEPESGDGWHWQTWTETTAQARRVLAVRSHALAPGVTVREQFDGACKNVHVAAPAMQPAETAVPADAVRADASAKERDTAASASASAPAPASASASAPAPAPASASAPAPAPAPAPARGQQLVVDRRRGRWLDAHGVEVELTLDDVTLASAPGVAAAANVRALPFGGDVAARAVAAGLRAVDGARTGTIAADAGAPPRAATSADAASSDAGAAADSATFAAAGPSGKKAKADGVRHAGAAANGSVSRAAAGGAIAAHCVSSAAGTASIVPALHRICELRLSVADPRTPEARIAALRALFRAARELSGAWPAFPALASVLDRACAADAPNILGAPLKAKPVDLSRMRAQRAAVFALGCNVTEQWFGNEAGVRASSDPEYVHQMRVALRRLHTLARLFPRYADAGWKEAFSADLRWLGGLLGAVRDWDVCATSTFPTFADTDGDPAGWAAMLDAAGARGEAARAELRQALGTARYARLALAWLEWLCMLAHDDPSHDDDAPSLKRHAARCVRRLFGRLHGRARLTVLDAAARHRVRIDAKRLRYALEFFLSLTSRRTRDETLKHLASIQTVLGDANDAAVALGSLERLSAPPYQLGFARGYGAAAQRHAAETAETLLCRMRAPKIRGKRA
ncbi:CHAD domain-containing protein [Burkholderia singularis]|uniref:Adenylate cyclase n=1 Tax=Burkholderia singularis TaxID=1503053 RepID=A0A238H2I0_9BURK|nr:CHAD domain-containing protein [Burkholderia singularis]SMF99432.1 Adenylate cyclase [Burkholderia singularis]